MSTWKSQLDLEKYNNSLLNSQDQDRRGINPPSFHIHFNNAIEMTNSKELLNKFTFHNIDTLPVCVYNFCYELQNIDNVSSLYNYTNDIVDKYVEELTNYSLNLAIASLVGVLQSNYNSVIKIEDETMSLKKIISGLELLGDKEADVAAIIMHSKVFSDLRKEFNTSVFGLKEKESGITYYNKPIFVFDSEYLKKGSLYSTLILFKNACNLYNKNIEVLNAKSFDYCYRYFAQNNIKIQVRGYKYIDASLKDSLKNPSLESTDHWLAVRPYQHLKFGPGSLILSR